LTTRNHHYAGITDFECKVFKAVKDGRADAKLFYNDYNHESAAGWMSNKSDAVFNFVSGLKAQGSDCPIDGVGFQMHIDVKNFNDAMVTGLRTNIQRYAGIGVEVHFTEVDVKNSDFTGDAYFSEACARNTKLERDIIPPALTLAMMVIGNLFYDVEWYYTIPVAYGLW